MNEEVKAKWIAKLEEGGPQTRGYLGRKQGGGRCCLGVLCDIAVEDGIIPAPKIGTEWNEKGDKIIVLKYGKNEDTCTLPIEVRNWAGLTLGDPNTSMTDRYNDPITLAGCNDTKRMKFSEIAEVIKRDL